MRILSYNTIWYNHEYQLFTVYTRYTYITHLGRFVYYMISISTHIIFVYTCVIIKTNKICSRSLTTYGTLYNNMNVQSNVYNVYSNLYIFIYKVKQKDLTKKKKMLLKRKTKIVKIIRLVHIV